MVLASLEQDGSLEPAEAASPDPMDVDGEATEAQSISRDSLLTKDQWSAIQQITEKVYKYRTKEKVNKRLIPDYYDVIKEPVALSTLKNKILRKAYVNFEEFVRDAALISHNAQTYNRPEAGAYHDAITLRDIFQKEFIKLVDQSVITSEASEYPDLGELPAVEDVVAPAEVEEEEEDEEEEDEEEDDDEDEDEDSEEEGGKRRRRRGHDPSPRS
ncbi:uncharacterized protein KY384_005922 [Bacidia gigantensis]|uniref:uncharacterized protein n=1 Tax=Bacidia gigantensis TaxID=2732470 RepID=UPI001D03F6EA|nr:uncharacterized protein KY384_005922 [Bacidia gigantensis]KAG8529287.1 hypothetical protein KY384_005922 [Bacidia gigantensis]